MHLGSVGSLSMFLMNAELSLHKHIVKAILPESMSFTLRKPGKISTTFDSVFSQFSRIRCILKILAWVGVQQTMWLAPGRTWQNWMWPGM